jgi:GT2 family glycosyltransferase
MINYNGANFIRETLPAALIEAHRFAELLFVDNGSTDGSADIVEREFPDVRVVRLPNNGGPGAARNGGFREAISELILFVDNDVSLTTGCLDALLRAIESDPDAVVAMPAVVYAHRRDTVQYCGAGSHFLGLMQLYEQNQPIAMIARAARRVSSVVTCAFLVDKAKLGEREPFDEAYFYQMEDHDFGVRLHGRGFTLLAVPEAMVLHGKGTEGMSVRREGVYHTIRVYCLIRNRWLFMLKQYRLRTLFVLSPALLVYEAAQLVIALKKGWMKEWGRSVGWIVGNVGTILDKRRRIMAERRWPDRELFLGGPIPFREELVGSALERLGKRLLECIARGWWKIAAALL